MAYTHKQGGMRLLLQFSGMLQLVRMLLVLGTCMLAGSKRWLAALLLALSLVVDGASAYLSRRLDLCSKTGAWLDSSAAPACLLMLSMRRKLYPAAGITLLCGIISTISAGIARNRQDFYPLTANWEKGISAAAHLPAFCGMGAVAAALAIMMLICRSRQFARVLRSQ